MIATTLIVENRETLGLRFGEVQVIGDPSLLAGEPDSEPAGTCAECHGISAATDGASDRLRKPFSTSGLKAVTPARKQVA
jgi:hypothetical protein